MTDGDDSRMPVTRRQVIAASSIVTVGAAGAFGTGDEGGILRGGTMALDQDYKLAESDRTLYQGPDSAKSGISGQVGDRYEAVDTGLSYHWDPDVGGWSDPHTIGSSSNPVPSVTTEDLVNVERFLSTDDDAAAVQSILDELNGDGGSAAGWKSGTHRYSTSTATVGSGDDDVAIVLKSFNDYVGRGYGSVLVQDAIDLNVLASDYDYAGATDNEDAGLLEHARIANLRLDGNRDAFSGFGNGQENNTLWLPFARNVTVENVWSHDVHQHGIHPDAIIDSAIRNCYIWNTDGQGIHAATRGIDADNVIYGPRDLTIERVVMWDIGTNGVGIGGKAIGCEVLDCTITSPGADGVSASGLKHTIGRNDIYNPGARGVNVIATPFTDGGGDQDAENVTVSENTVENASTHCFRYANCTGLRSEDNTAIGATTDGFNVGNQTDLVMTGDRAVNAGQNGFTFDTCPGARLSNLTARSDGSAQCIYDNGGSPGMVLVNCRGINGSGWASKIDSNRVTIIGFTAEDCDTGLNVRGDLAQIIGFEGENNTTDLRIDGNDCNIVAPTDPPNLSIADNGTRTRWGGVIGGGLLGGVDLGATVGQFVGDKALADGTTGTENLEAVWTGSAWQQSDGSATITPS